MIDICFQNLRFAHGGSQFVLTYVCYRAPERCTVSSVKKHQLAVVPDGPIFQLGKRRRSLDFLSLPPVQGVVTECIYVKTNVEHIHKPSAHHSCESATW